MMTYIVSLLIIVLAPAIHAGTWLEANIGVIGVASSDIFDSVLEEAESSKADGIIIVLDTPGGALDATRAMVKAMLASKIPIIVWVGPSGARAGSAGSFITLAAHVAVMAPSTQIGAAHPVNADGSDVSEGHLAEKIENDTVAFMESIAKARNRNQELARSFVITSTSVTAEEALEQKVIDFIAPDVPTLLKTIDGRVVTMTDNITITLLTKDAVIKQYDKSLQQRFLEVISNPNLFYLFFLAGLIGIGFELTHPGSLFPGIAGGICMVLALVAMSVLPVNFGALILLAIGIACIVAEIFLPSFGILGIGGVAAFSIGSFLLVDPHNTEGLRISLSVIVPGVITISLVAIGISYLVIKATRRSKLSGAEGMIRQKAVVSRDFLAGKGKVRINGELWFAEGKNFQQEDFKDGDAVEVVKVDGLTLQVKALTKSGERA